MKRAIVVQQFSGGWSVDEQVGFKNSFAYSKHVDFRKRPSRLSILPTTRKETGGVVVDLVQNEVMANDGKIYALGDTGHFYRRTTSAVWSDEAKLDDGAFGMSYRKDLEKLIMSSSTTVSEYSPLDNSPGIQVNKYGKSASADSNAFLSGGTQPYSLKAVISEATSDKQEYLPDIEPLVSIKVKVFDGGTGDWTLTLHDPANNTLATSTITSANITDGEKLEFTFSSQVRQYVKPNARTYHFHLTSSDGTGTAVCATGGDLNTCDYEIFADRLVDSNNGMHPIQTFLQYECIGNERYLSVWEPLSEEPDNSEWQRHRLTFPPGLEVCGLAVWNEYLAIACEQKATTGNAQQGYLFFWDGTATSYNYFVRIPEGSPYSLHEYKNVLYYFAGGAWFGYAGGEPIKIRTMPNTDSEYSDVTDSTIVYPNMATIRRGIHLMGFPSQTTNQSIEHGVYSYGAVDKNFPSSFGFNYTPSHGTITNDGSNNLRIGMVKNFGDMLHVSWRLNDSYGVDVIDNSSDPSSSAEWQSIFYDDGIPFKVKKALYMAVEFETLPAGATVTAKYRTARNGSWATSGTASSGTALRFDINTDFKEIQLGLDLVATTTTPVITSVSLIYDDCKEEGFS